MADPIEHVVVLMLENRSFDQMLGALQGIRPGVDGIDPLLGPGQRRVNLDRQGRPYYQEPGAARILKPDPRHETDHVLHQLEGMGNFVRDYQDHYSKARPEQLQQVMSYFPWGSLPALHTLAEQFHVCDRWHSSVPGPTWANRLFAWSGTSLGRVKMPEVKLPFGPFQPNLHNYNQPTIFDRLSERNKTWRVYVHEGTSLTYLLHNMRKLGNLNRVDNMNRFSAAAAGPEDQFPQFAFIEPRYTGAFRNDDHPPTDVMKGQALVASVYNQLRANEALWRKTLFVVLYDEHGGFYDHVEPTAHGAVPPDDHRADGFDFTRLGVRIPAVLVSPWLDPGVCHDVFDHTSLLKYLTDKWNLGPLGARVATAKSFSSLLTQRASPRTDTLLSLSATVPAVTLLTEALANMPDPVTLEDLNENHAVLALSQLLEADIGDPEGVRNDRAARMLGDTAVRHQVVLERFERLRQRAAE
ncbi:phospholipase C [Corallococcus llansteffanensis]|nr:alkaline phosphatase family protein [Corallococcus llansteffanensis]